MTSTKICVINTVIWLNFCLIWNLLMFIPTDTDLITIMVHTFIDQDVLVYLYFPSSDYSGYLLKFWRLLWTSFCGLLRIFYWFSVVGLFDHHLPTFFTPSMHVINGDNTGNNRNYIIIFFNYIEEHDLVKKDSQIVLHVLF